jgi:hypothetical protein
MGVLCLVTWCVAIEISTHHAARSNMPIRNILSIAPQLGISQEALIATHHVTKHNTPIHNILSTVTQLSISQKALGTLPEDGNVMPKHVGATMHNKLNE